MPNKPKYPGIAEAETEKSQGCPIEDKPDWLGNAPNYDKFKNWTPEEVLVWLNID